MGQAELERILAAADVHEHGGGIDYEEFLAATMNLSKMQQQEKYLHEAFDVSGGASRGWGVGG
jgi:Ca2+-binding EF-hand superfamily protein